MAKRIKLNPFRRGVQWLILLMLVYLLVRPLIDRAYTADFEAYCPFGGLQAFTSFLNSNSLACSMTTTQIFMGFGLLVGIILISKLFCSYICPIGTFTEWLGRMGKKFKLNKDIKGLPDRLLRIVKYALLFVTFYFSVTSSELFCKTFDPYYAVFTGFSSDVVMSYAAIALLLTIPGSFFIKQFWCKYACPLGAASNIFTYSYVFIGLTAVYAFLVVVLKLSVSWLWLLGSLTLAGVLLETLKVKTSGLSLFGVSRNADTCTSCKLCDKACPMSIKVSTAEKVKDIDCHLCGDCVASCPEDDTLSITGGHFLSKKLHNARGNQSLLWLPAAAVVVLVIIGLAFAERIHIPTISLKWGDATQMKEAGIYEQTGLTSIKCFGSSMSFANHMKEMQGVLGVETFVSDHSVKVFYDKAVYNDEDIKRAIFNPVKRLYKAPENQQSIVAVCEAAIDQFFDPNDAELLSIRFMQHEGILSMQTLFGEPVHALIYYSSELTSMAEIKALIEEKKVIWEVEGDLNVAKTSYKVASIHERDKISLKQYLETLYEPVSMTFNSFEKYGVDLLETIEYPFTQGADPALTDMPWYLLSHLSNNQGIVSFETHPSDEGLMLRLQIVKSLVSKEEVDALINLPELKVHLSDGTKQSIKNPYRFRY